MSRAFRHDASPRTKDDALQHAVDAVRWLQAVTRLSTIDAALELVRTTHADWSPAVPSSTDPMRDPVARDVDHVLSRGDREAAAYGWGPATLSSARDCPICGARVGAEYAQLERHRRYHERREEQG